LLFQSKTKLIKTTKTFANYRHYVNLRMKTMKISVSHCNMYTIKHNQKLKAT